MKSTKVLLLLCSLFLFGTNTYAQQRCGTDAHMQELLANPLYAKNYEKQQKKFKKYSEDNPIRALCANPVLLPMAVHYQGISNPDEACLIELALNQIQLLNDDYHGVNADITNWTNGAASTFPGVDYGETCIEFCLASTNHPSGFGLNNGDYAVTFNAFNGDYNDSWSGYINIFVRDITPLGYSPLPGSGNGDGVAMDIIAFGSGAGCPGVTPTPPYHLGRTLTHELGHYLNLRHIWGDGNGDCSIDDNVADTPDQADKNFGCPALGIASCNSPDMHMNYMDYSNDPCLYMFTAGQSTRMENYTNSNLQHVITKGQTVCAPPADPTCDDGIQNQGETGIDCGGPCTAICPTCTDGIQNGDEEGVDCGGSSCDPCPCNGTGVRVSITFDNYPEETSWTITDASGTTVESGGTYGSEADGSTLTVDLCLANGCYDFTITDVYGDGICCGYGNGSYTLTDGAGNVLASGSEFGSSELTNFCLTPTTLETCDDGIQNQDETGVDCGGATCPACSPCEVPTPTAIVISGACVKIDWAAIADATEYKCRYRMVGGSWIEYTAKFDLSFLNNLTVGSSYQFQVKSKCDGLNSVWSPSITFTTATDDCDRPNTVTVGNITATSCLVSWSQDTDDLKYKVGYKKAGTSGWTQIFVDLPNTSRTISGLTSGADYKARVKTKCSGGWTNWSPKEDFTTLSSFGFSNAKIQEESTLSIYPNPVNHLVNIMYQTDKNSIIRIKVFDILGKVLISKSVSTHAGQNSVQLDVSQLQTGSHYVRVHNGDQQLVQRFVKL